MLYKAAERLGPPLLNTHTRRAPRQPVTDAQAKNLHRGSKGTGQPASRAQGRAGRATKESSNGHASVRPCCLGETMARCPNVRVLTESGCKFAANVTVCSICVHMHGSCGRETPAVACVANVHAVASQRYARSARAFSLCVWPKPVCQTGFELISLSLDPAASRLSTRPITLRVSVWLTSHSRLPVVCAIREAPNLAPSARTVSLFYMTLDVGRNVV